MNGWKDVFDAVKERHSLMSEFELAFHLGVPPPTISHIRSGERRPSAAVACKILNKAGYALTRDMFLAMLPKSAAQAFLKAERKRMLSAFERDNSQKQYQAILNQDGNVDWLLALEVLKAKRKITTDRDLASTLKIATSALCNVKNGSRPLTTAAKIYLLSELGIALDAKTLAKAVPPDFEEAITQGKLTLDFMPKNA